MEKNTSLNKNNEFENNKFDDLKNETFDNVFVNKKMTTKPIRVSTTMSKNKIIKKHGQFQISLNID